MDKLKEKKLKEGAIKLKFFHLKTGKPDEFIAKLEQLCREYCHQEDFFFRYSIED